MISIRPIQYDTEIEADAAIDEPEQAAWDCHGYEFITQDDAAASCDSRTCEIVCREELDDEGDGDGIPPDETRRRPQDEEHVAGPECTSTSGYNGHKICVQEMQHVISCQCLEEKREGWTSEPGDRDFELEAERCFLTGISKLGVSEGDVTGLEPARHGVSEVIITNTSPGEIGLDPGEMWALPMHPRCFELFQRVSLRHFGKVDIESLWRLREERGSFESRFVGMPSNPDVKLVSEQWYSARPGTEYLAADPVDVPGLSTLIHNCLVKEGDVCESVFDACEHTTDKAEHYDPFTRLPPELQQILLEQLSRQDVANLRLVSPIFKQLPQTYFRHLVETEMPWLWEVSDLPKHRIDFYRLWCRLHEADGGSQQDLHERQWLEQTPRKKLDALRNEIESELESKRMSAIPPPRTWFYAEFNKRAPKLRHEAEAEIQAGYENGMRQRKPANVLLGLRNRRRIWQDVEIIVRMISELDLTSDEE
ncbi:hypothetical protein KC319_g1909 [Hortaea werneckii]|nr:hypothetical protein KC352_g25652 [Hortaea werneckii]KAI7571226.1 hypothetical protein KC317_g1804 [Hortaea werneckii]KAI7625011.1 hypothetical protein KC346_g1935 [Hortaea werneckii]KAI7680876.1 hypothetical protein KC319_g1909 [Hortaea werneckii]KAI7718286.1 hypothetical protein KC322_g2266 [Hortaea werneckii]